MKQLLRLVPISLSMLIGFSLPTEAQKTYAIGLGGGAAIPVGKLSDSQKTGYNAIAAVAIGIAGLPLSLRFDAIYNHILNKDDLSSPSGSGSNLRVSGVLGNLVFAFPGSSAKAYIIAGGGLYNSKPDVSGAKAQNNFG